MLEQSPGAKSSNQGPKNFRAEGVEQVQNLPKRGDRVILKKLSMEKGTFSKVKTGEELAGALLSDIQIGQSVVVADAGKTSRVRNIHSVDKRVFIETQTSTYEVFKG